MPFSLFALSALNERASVHSGGYVRDCVCVCACAPHDAAAIVVVIGVVVEKSLPRNGKFPFARAHKECLGLCSLYMALWV